MIRLRLDHQRPARPRALMASALLAMLAASAHPAAAQGTPTAAAAAAIVHQGNARGAPPCISCHGPKLEGLAAMVSPRIAGQSAAYVVAQLDAFAGGTRRNAIMLPVATALSPAERQALGTYLSTLTPVAAPASDSAPPPAAVLRSGERLATRGRWAAGVPACDQCHGPGGVGVGAAFPPLAGQSSAYLAAQLDAYRQGTRPPGPLGLMSTLVSRMSDADIAAVSAYYQRQPPAAATGGRP